ncbi:hypothetical protein SLEP1_g41053 [Rubroshorea leprosula]|uniref:Laccase n=1 Tax=Rubroshorea leprosula TaxID=152421 RepID=A0AAV5L5Q9_9ROSI|nr:hypothetical protein SLEP1_g41053 [Rubroshorea leprosula]
MKVSIYKLLGFLLFFSFYHCQAWPRYEFVVKEAPYTRLCSTKNILTVNCQFPGPTLNVNRGDTIVVDVYNRGNYNITIHWHGVKQPRNPWSDGPKYITHTWLRATVHGALIIYPKIGTTYPFPKPDVEIPIILGEWRKEDIMQVYLDLERYAGLGVLSDAYLINGQPGDLYPCSKPVKAILVDNLFFAIANHTVMMVGSDASYLKPFNRTFICLTPCQTVDILLEANQSPNHYYMAASVYTTVLPGSYNNSTTTAIVEYNGNYTPSSPPVFPYLPEYNETEASINFAPSFRSLADKEHPIDVPMEINTHLFYTLSLGSPCKNNSCPGVYGTNLPDFPQLFFHFTADYLPMEWEIPQLGTEGRVLDYNSTVELVFQATNLIKGADHGMHLYGHSFYVVGLGLWNFDKDKDPLTYNLVDPPLQNTIHVPRNGWMAIRFKANNPGVWHMHCHIDQHMVWGMGTAFIVKDGESPEAKMLPPPPDMPPC